MLLRFFPAEAVGNIVKFLGMHPCERSDKVPENKNTHTLLLAGKKCLWPELLHGVSATGFCLPPSNFPKATPVCSHSPG